MRNCITCEVFLLSSTVSTYRNKTIVPIVVKILKIFCPIVVQIVPGCCFVAPAMPDCRRRRLQPMLTSSYDLNGDCNHGFAFLEDNTEYLVLEFVRD